MNNESVLVSIGVITYNQEKYIAQTLDSIIRQKTNFKFEILINDDASTDKTKDIIKQYETKYPDTIKPVYQIENQFSKGLGIIKNFICPRAKNKYFIICEGDDYFTDPDKLQKQVDFLEANPQFVGCFHPVKVFYEGNEKKDEIFPSKKMLRGKKIIKLEDLLKQNCIQTNSVMYRWRFVEEDIRDVFPDNILPGDLYLHLLHAQKGSIALLPDVMSAYRRHQNGIWWESQSDVEKLHLKHGLREINFFVNVYKNITNSSKEYLNKILLPSMKSIMDTFYKHKKYCELEKISSQYPEIYDLVFETYKEHNNSAVKKVKKYRKLFKIALLVSIISLLLNFAVLLHYIF